MPRNWYLRQRDGVTVHLTGSYEYRFAKVLDRLKLDWLAHGEFAPLIYRDESGNRHRYMPDFFVRDWRAFVETKGWFREKDQLKMRLVAEQNPGVSIVIVQKDALDYFERTGQLP